MRHTFLILFSIPTVISLAGCNTTGLASSPTVSRLGTVSNGQVQASLSQERNGSVSDATVGTAAYVIGIDQNRGQFVAIAGTQDANVGSAVTSGTAKYSTSYSYQVVDEIDRSSTMISGYTGRETGTFTLRADFDAGTVKGRGDELAINGTVNGTAMSGDFTANYEEYRFLPGGSTFSGSLKGKFQGEIGSTGVIGVYHGSDANTVLAGGLVGTRN